MSPSRSLLASEPALARVPALGQSDPKPPTPPACPTFCRPHCIDKSAPTYRPLLEFRSEDCSSSARSLAGSTSGWCARKRSSIPTRRLGSVGTLRTVGLPGPCIRGPARRPHLASLAEAQFSESSIASLSLHLDKLDDPTGH